MTYIIAAPERVKGDVRIGRERILREGTLEKWVNKKRGLEGGVRGSKEENVFKRSNKTVRSPQVKERTNSEVWEKIKRLRKEIENCKEEIK